MKPIKASTPTITLRDLVLENAISEQTLLKKNPQAEINQPKYYLAVWRR